MDLRNLFGPLKFLFPAMGFEFVGTTAAIIGGGLLAAGGSIAGSVVGADAAGDASRAAEQGQRDALAAQERLAREGMAYQERQSNAAMDFLRQQYAQAQQQLQPYEDIQRRATQGLEAFADQNSPYYQQQRQAMTQAIQQQLAAQGLLRSKDQTLGLTDLELGLNQQRLGVQQGLAGLGAAQNLAGITQNYGSGIAGIQQGLGQTVGSQFGALGGQQAQTAQNLAQLNAQRIQAGAANTQGLIGGLTNVGSNIIGGISSANQNALTNALLARSMGIKDRAGLSALLDGFK